MTSRSRCGSASSARRTFSLRRFSEAISNGEIGGVVLDEVAQLGLLLLADRLLERDRLLRHAQDVAHLARRALELARDLLRQRLAAELLDELALDVHDLVQLLHHVDGDADRAALVRDRPRHRLADPPGRVGRELVAAPVVELLHRADEAERALLDQVQERQAAARGSPWRSRRRGAGWPRPSPAWPPGRRARSAGPARPRARRSAAERGRSSAGRAAANPGWARPSGRSPACAVRRALALRRSGLEAAAFAIAGRPSSAFTTSMPWSSRYACSSATCSLVTSTSSSEEAICSKVRNPRSWPSE